MNYTSSVEEIINEMPFNKIFNSKELYIQYKLTMNEKTYYKILSRLVQEHVLSHLTKGLYYRIKKTIFGEVPIDEKSITDYFTDNGCGIIIGYRLYNSLGLTTQISKNIEILSNKQDEDIKHIQNIEVKKIGFIPDKKTIKLVECMDVIQNYNKIEDLDTGKFCDYIYDVSKCYSDDSFDIVLKHIKYKKSTIAFFHHLLLILRSHDPAPLRQFPYLQL